MVAQFSVIMVAQFLMTIHKKTGRTPSKGTQPVQLLVQIQLILSRI
jgi:hypothetical protein